MLPTGEVLTKAGYLRKPSGNLRKGFKAMNTVLEPDSKTTPGQGEALLAAFMAAGKGESRGKPLGIDRRSFDLLEQRTIRAEDDDEENGEGSQYSD